MIYVVLKSTPVKVSGIKTFLDVPIYTSDSENGAKAYIEIERAKNDPKNKDCLFRVKELDVSNAFPFEEDDVIQIFTDQETGEKWIKLLGYGYMSDSGEDDRIYRIIEFKWFEVPLSKALEYGVGEYFCSKASEYDANIGDVTKEEMEEAYMTWDNGNMPKILLDITMDTPDGIYIHH